jgi:hypothetical protein
MEQTTAALLMAGINAKLKDKKKKLEKKPEPEAQVTYAVDQIHRLPFADRLTRSK